MSGRPLKRFLAVIGLALSFGLLYWVLDGFYDYLTFSYNLRTMLFQEPLTLGDSILFNVPRDDLLARIVFLMASLVGGFLTLSFLTRKDRAEEMLRESEVRFRFLSEAADEAVAIHNNGTVIYANKAYQDLFGYQPEGDTMARALAITVAPKSLDAVLEQIRNGTTGPYRIIAMRSNGEQFPLEIQAKQVEHGGRTVRVASMRDISRQLESEDRLKNLSAKVLSAQEEERVRVGRELHDSTAQSLGAIKLLVENEIARIKECTNGCDTLGLVKVVSAIQSAIGELRNIIMNLRPTMLDDLGLTSALRWLAAEMDELHKEFSITCRVEVDGVDLEPTAKTVLFRVAQEALTNAVRHSRGDRVELWLREKNNAVVLTVQDNGQGFKPEDALPTSVGIESMHERLELVGGRLTIDAGAGRGTRVTAKVPLPR